MKSIRFLFLVVVIMITLFSCSERSIAPSTRNGNQLYINEIKTFQDTMNAEFTDSARSPLTQEDLVYFKNLHYFPIDVNFRIEAKFTRTPDQPVFGMKTTTTRLPDYKKYGEATFMLNGKTFTLNIYQNQQLMLKEGYFDHLFLPFTDLTNGRESYGGGRYLDLKIPAGDTIIIDFNKAYNPYCAYNHKYSCPIPPKENDLQTEIKAGVKKFH